MPARLIPNPNPAWEYQHFPCFSVIVYVCVRIWDFTDFLIHWMPWQPYLRDILIFPDKLIYVSHISLKRKIWDWSWAALWHFIESSQSFPNLEHTVTHRPLFLTYLLQSIIYKGLDKPLAHNVTLGKHNPCPLSSYPSLHLSPTPSPTDKTVPWLKSPANWEKMGQSHSGSFVQSFFFFSQVPNFLCFHKLQVF